MLQSPSLAELVSQARADVVLAGPSAEVNRVMQICNACRYCEGFCGVFPAMTRRLEFKEADIHFLANLCHNCGACLHACQYAPPHEFAVNVPQAMARVRLQTYTDYAFPSGLGVLYKRNGLVMSMALSAALIVFLILALWQAGSLWPEATAGNFYAIFPHNLLVVLFVSVFAFASLALAIGVARFWAGAPPATSASSAGTLPAAAGETLKNVLSLKYLDGGHGDGCHDEDDRATHWRRRFHHATFYGFMLCLASTSVATLYHYFLDLKAPYPIFSLPVLLGIVGGIGLLVGPLGLVWLKLKRHPLHGDDQQNTMDYGFIALLFFISLTGLAVTAWRDTSALALLLAVHLGFVMAFFLTMPYGKFAHGVFRGAALLKWAIEKRQPSKLRLGD
jgi:citrate/tricarballylate utilization protein